MAFLTLNVLASDKFNRQIENDFRARTIGMSKNDKNSLPGGRAERYSFVNPRTKSGMDERDSSKNPAF